MATRDGGAPKQGRQGVGVARTTPTVVMAWSVTPIDSDLAAASVLRTVPIGSWAVDTNGLRVVATNQTRGAWAPNQS